MASPLLSRVLNPFSNISFITALVLTGCSLLCCFPATAQVKDSIHQQQDTSRQLKGVQVTTSRAYIQATSPVPVQVLRGAQLEQINSLSVADAIRYFSGVQLKDYGGVGGLKTINVRSLGTNHTAVFYDGVEFGNSQNGQVDLGKFSLDNIEEIALYDGQQNSIFQPAKGFAPASALYLTAKRPKFTDSANFVGKVSLKAGSFGLINPSINAAYKFGSNAYATVSSELIHANGRYKFTTFDGGDTTAVRHNGDIDAQRIEGAVSVTSKDSATWKIRGYLYHSDRGLPAAVVNHNFDSDQRQWDKDIFVQSSYQTNPSNRDSWIINAKYSDDYTRYFDPDITTTRGLLDDKYIEKELYFSVANRYRITKQLSFDISADYQRNQLDATQNDTVQYRFVSPVRNQLLLAAAGELKLQHLDIQADLLATYVNDTVDTLTAAGRKTEYTPAFLFSWQPFENPDFHVRGFYKNTFRLPTFNDLYFTFIGNSFLKPEFARQSDIGITYTKNWQQQALLDFFLQADGYYNQVRDKIVAIPGQNLARWTMYNIGEVHTTGLDIDASATWALPANIRLSTGITYTYQNGIDVTSGGDSYGQEIPYTPKNSGSLLIGLQKGHFLLNYSFIYTGARYDEDANIPRNYLPPWYTHDMSITYTGNFQRHHIKITGEINNLLNQQYEVIQNFPMPGRNYRITISTNI
ncbi:TonB-dependent receptor plug domain-containing protein [Mucilaginibacter sp. McL0603]|uniref:TonB-dependent receptor plug domain-containing protein n=1 Tax=Mucilaginibacter sp. McL0603 TaxID=3415670 RepID=UPI003CF50206